MLFKTAVNSTENTQRLNYSCKSVNAVKEMTKGGAKSNQNYDAVVSFY
jgi:hypothetical protein